MRIELSGYGLKRLDETNLVVFKVVERERKATGDKYLDDTIIGYYSTLEAGLRGLLKYKLKATEATSLQELIAHVEAVHKEVKGLKCK